MSDKSDFWNSNLADCIGFAILILAICWGIGGCMYLEVVSHRKDVPTSIDVAK